MSRSELKLTFDDDKKSIRLETPGGRNIFMDDDSGVIQFADGSGNKITMDDNGITIQSSKKITLTSNDDISIQGNNISSSAPIKFKADGAAGLELTSSANGVVK